MLTRMSESPEVTMQATYSSFFPAAGDLTIAQADEGTSLGFISFEIWQSKIGLTTSVASLSHECGDLEPRGQHDIEVMTHGNGTN